MIPTALGNIVGGGFFVGTAYWYLYLTGDVSKIQVSFNVGSLDTAMDAGGPMRDAKSDQRGDTETIIGTDPDDLPHSGGNCTSAIGMELGDNTPYTMSHAERKRSPESSSEEKV